MATVALNTVKFIEIRKESFQLSNACEEIYIISI